MSGYIGSKTSVTLVDGYNRTEADAEFVQDPNGAITVDGSNVGIGTSNPSEALTVIGSSVVGDTTTSYNQLTVSGGHVGDGDNDYGITINAFEPAITFLDRSSGAGSGQMRVHSNGSFHFLADTTNDGTIGHNVNTTDFVIAKLQPDQHSFYVNNGATEALRIDSGGNVLAGKTSPSISSVGVEMRGSSGILTATSQDDPTVYFTRKGTAGGPIITFYRDTTHAGVIGVGSDADLYIGEDNVGLQFQNTGTDRIDPYDVDGNTVRDNAIDLGGSSSRFDDVYATNGSIQTSDRNEKQNIAALTATEMLVAARISGLFKTFRWIDSVADKGDNARTHTVVIAQYVQAAFTAEGLDAGDYALFTSATWWETQTDVVAVEADPANDIEAADAYTRTDSYDTLAEAPDGATERTRMGIRYPELLAFVGAYNEQRFASIETRLAALEAV